MTSPVAKAYQERHPDMAVRLTHRLTPDDVERIVDALEVDGLFVGIACEYGDPASIARITAALCGGSEQDYEA